MAKGRTKRFLITGLAALLPTLLTVYLLYAIVVWVHEHIGSKFNRWFGIKETSWTVFAGDAIAFVVLVGIVWLIGFILATYVGRVLFRRLDRAYRRIPLIRIVYPAVKQVTDFFLVRRNVRFRRVVAVQYPRLGVYSIGFITGDGLSQVRTDDGEQLMSVFIPSSPAPITGYTLFVRRSEVVSLDLSVDEAVKLVISGGVVVPDRENLLIAPELGDEPAEDTPETPVLEG
ncbi:MAG: DUF502 domain-containing protein [Planctomycetota bacterium]